MSSDSYKADRAVRERRRLEHVIENFDPFGVDPLHASMQCVDESFRFHFALADAGVESECVFGVRDAGDGLGIAFDGHTVVRVGDVTYDWTARQFDPDAPLPLIQTYDEFRHQWAEVTGYGHEQMRMELAWLD